MSGHITVLPSEAIDALKVTEDSVIVDATANGGGHSRKIREQLGNGGLLVSLDVDPVACTTLREIAQDTGAPMKVVCANFRAVHASLIEVGISGNVNGILADLGWSTNQFEKGGRGFSFMHDEPLLMTYGDASSYLFTACDIVNSWKEVDIANVLFAYGDERKSRAIAKAIVSARKEEEISTSGQLARVILSVLPQRGRIHPATKTFQALRIAVNDEYRALTDFLHGAMRSLKVGGRLAVITFHSGEDRIVKDIFRTWSKDGIGTLVTKKPQIASRAEMLSNPRARSAKLRIIEKQENETHTHNSTAQ